MRNDSLGLFWEDVSTVKVKKEKVKKVPPKPVWLEPSYLPGLEEARRFDVQLMYPNDMQDAIQNNKPIFFDVECYVNYFLVSFMTSARRLIYFEKLGDGPLSQAERQGILWCLENFLTVGFNSIGYDLVMCKMAIAGRTLAEMKEATQLIIESGLKPYDVLTIYKSHKKMEINHIDIIEVAPLSATLKRYGGRIHVIKMQDLPFHPSTVLNRDQADIVRWYNVDADLPTTIEIYKGLREQLNLRISISSEIGKDVRSKSDAQIAEAFISSKLERIMGVQPSKPTIPIGTIFKYAIPHFLKFSSPMLQTVLGIIGTANYIVGDDGKIISPPEIENLNIKIGETYYKMGIGGLHSKDEKVVVIADEEYILKDVDATSFYPFIILILGLFPPHLGKAFLKVFNDIVNTRVAAKKSKNEIIAETLKIVINGTYGKLSSKYSIFYAPGLQIQVTLTGQLALLMLAERFELCGIQVASANTDGLVIKCPRKSEKLMDTILANWEREVGFKTEEVLYSAIYARDVNNYFAIKTDGGIKGKGAYANPWTHAKNPAAKLHKNPTSTICVDAVEKYLTKGIPIADTILKSKDITKFVNVRYVKGGGVKIWPNRTGDEQWEFLGKDVRWYYAKGIEGNIVYAKSGNQVPKSVGAKPCMVLPAEFPDDIDYDWYIEAAQEILVDIGYIVA